MNFSRLGWNSSFGRTLRKKVDIIKMVLLCHVQNGMFLLHTHKKAFFFSNLNICTPFNQVKSNTAVLQGKKTPAFPLLNNFDWSRIAFLKVCSQSMWKSGFPHQSEAHLDIHSPFVPHLPLNSRVKVFSSIKLNKIFSVLKSGWYLSRNLVKISSFSIKFTLWMSEQRYKTI